MLGGGRVDASANAAAALTIPAPQVAVVQSAPVPVGKTRALVCKVFNTCVGDNDGFTDNISATTPETWAVDMLVP